MLGLYTFSKALGFDVETLNWIPLVAFSFVIFIANWGLMTLPFMIVSEITHPKVNMEELDELIDFDFRLALFR